MFNPEQLVEYHKAVDLLRAFGSAHSSCVPYHVALDLAQALKLAQYECKTIQQFSLEGASVILDALAAFEPYRKARESCPSSST